MPIANLIDSRTRPYRFKEINAVVEATWHDNIRFDADTAKAFSKKDDGPRYDQREHITLNEAINWASSFKQDVTLYLYDHDDGIYTSGALAKLAVAAATYRARAAATYRARKVRKP